VGTPATVTVLAPGAAPRAPLRYMIAADHKSVMDVTMGIGMNMNMGGTSVPMNLPPIVMSATTDVTGVAPNGDITFNVAFTKMSLGPGADPNITATMEGVAASITALKGTVTMSSRGVTKAVQLDYSKVDPSLQQALAQMTSSIENIAAPLPEEAVGAGAQ